MLSKLRQLITSYCSCLSLLCIPYVNCFAQDTIIKRTGEKIAVKLTEVNDNSVEYVLFDYQTGPKFTLLKDEIKNLVYVIGVIQSCESYVPPPSVQDTSASDLSMYRHNKRYYFKGSWINEPDMLLVLSKQNNKEFNLTVKKVNRKGFIQKSTAMAGVVLLASGLFGYETSRPFISLRGSLYFHGGAPGQLSGEVLMIAGLASELISLHFMISRKHEVHRLVDEYNKATPPF